ncbi:MAG: hypothetical protein JJU21_03520 [Salinarimonas sp.]|nr:hypothetical protein [Salinarimonas sp.]
MFFLIRFLGIVAVIFYFSPERGVRSAAQTSASPEVAASVGTMLQENTREAGSPSDIAENSGDQDIRLPVPDDIAGLIAREIGVQWQALPESARERLVIEIMRRAGPETVGSVE